MSLWEPNFKLITKWTETGAPVFCGAVFAGNGPVSYQGAPKPVPKPTGVQQKLTKLRVGDYPPTKIQSGPEIDLSSLSQILSHADYLS